MNLCELLENPKSQGNYNVARNSKRDSSKMSWIGRSAAKHLLNGEGSTTRELCPVGYKRLVSEAHSTPIKGEDIVCSALKDAGVDLRGFEWYAVSTLTDGGHNENNSRAYRKIQRKVGTKQRQWMLGMATCHFFKGLWADKNTQATEADSSTQTFLLNTLWGNS